MIVAGTGHRPNKLGGYHKAAEQNLINIAIEWLKIHQPSAVISGMALGWDTAIALSAIMLDIPLIAAIPFKGQELKWIDFYQEQYNKILYNAVEIKIVSEGGYAAWKMQVRNKWMVDNCHGVLAMWDGTSGGTKNCIDYAMKQEKPIFNLYDKYKND